MEGLEGWVGRKGGERGRRAAGSTLLTGFLLPVLIRIKCVKSYLCLRGIVLDEVASFKGFGTIDERVNMETEETLSLALG